MSTATEMQLDNRNRDDIVTNNRRSLFRLYGDVECGDCGGEGGIEIDTTRAIHWEPHSEFVECSSCEGSGCVPEPPDNFIQRAINGRPELADTPKPVIAALINMAITLDSNEDFEVDTKRSVAMSLGYRIPKGADYRVCNELERG